MKVLGEELFFFSFRGEVEGLGRSFGVGKNFEEKLRGGEEIEEIRSRGVGKKLRGLEDISLEGFD